MVQFPCKIDDIPTFVTSETVPTILVDLQACIRISVKRANAEPLPVNPDSVLFKQLSAGNRLLDLVNEYPVIHADSPNINLIVLYSHA